MELIKKLLEEAEEQNLKEGNAFITERNSQKLREQWILGKFSENYNKKAQHKLIYAEPLEGPDFRIFDSEKKHVFYVEITEALDEGRKRTLEYRTNEKRGEEIPKADYLSVIQRLISEKCSRKYPHDTILIIYLNLSIYRFEPQTFSRLYLPERCNLLQIWLLDSGGDNRILQIS